MNPASFRIDIPEVQRLKFNEKNIIMQTGFIKIRKIGLSAVFICLMPLLSAQQDTLRFDGNVVSDDSIEYELIVIDPGYEFFLATQKHMEFYSQHYYESWNQRYVTEWNYRHSQPLRYGDIYETYIDYSPHIDYGLELNYKLYYYFRFFEKKHDVKLLPERAF
jgi:hypothetical protein